MVTSDWSERTSWKTQPLTWRPNVSMPSCVPGDGWKTFDVTQFMLNARSDNLRHGVMLRFGKEDRSGSKGDWSGHAFVSREAEGEWEAFRPVLLVVDAEPRRR